MLEPDILLLDEPFSALDYQTRLEVADDIWGIIRKEKKTAILITHDISEAISMSDRVIILTKRPGTVKRIFDIKLSITDRTPFTARSAPEFTDYFNLIWKELNNLSRRNRKVSSESLNISAAQKAYIRKHILQNRKNSYYTNYYINRFCCFLGNQYLYWHCGSVYIL